MNFRMKAFAVIALVVALAVAGCGGGSQPVAITLTPGAAQSAVAGQSLNITATVSNDTLNKGVTWSLSGPGTLSAQTATSVTYTAPSPIAANATVTITATSVSDTTRSTTLTINLLAVSIALTPGTTQTDEQGQTTGITAAVSNDPANKGVTWSLTGAGALSGQTALAVTYTAPASITAASTATVTATSVFDGTKTTTLTINLVPPPSITTASLPNATEGTAYSQTITATGGIPPYTFSIVVPGTGTLPAGLTMSAAGVISGTPMGPNGTSNFTVKVTDSGNPNQSGTRNLSITVNLPPPPSITTTLLASGTEGTAYNQTIAATGGLPPYTFAVPPGTLPAGLSMDSSGHITGTPTGPNGTTSFTVTVTDKSNPPQTGSKGLSITINLPPAPVISPTTLPNGNVGTPYNQTLSVTGGLGPFTWVVSSGTLPLGLTLTSNNTTAKISGTPTTQQNNVAFTIQVTDTSNPPQSGQQAYTVTINPPVPLAITTTSPLPNGAFNTAYSTTINATGGIAPYTFSLDAASSPLPAGLSFTNDAVNNQGVISGKPTTAGTFTGIIIDVHDSQTPAATASQTFTLTITAPAVVISPASGSLPNGTQGTAYSANITATGGVQPYTFSLDPASVTLPAGLSFNAMATQATISGTPSATGTTTGIIVDVKDSEQPPVTQKVTYSLTVNASAAACGTGSESLLNGQYAFALQGFNGTNPVGIGGIFDADGLGHIAKTVGIVDINDGGPSGVQLNQAITSAGSSYSIGLDQRGCMTIITGAVSRTFRFSLGNITTGVASTGHVIQFDTSGEFVAGILRKQDPAGFSPAAINGNYAFGATAPRASSGKFAVVGTFTASGGATISAGQADTDDNGNVDQMGAAFTYPPTAFSFAGTYTIAANGRGTFTIAPPGTIVHANLYVVSASEMLMLSTDSQATNSLFVGSALQTTQSTFAPNSLNAPGILYTTGLQNNGTTTVSRVQAGILTANGTGSSFTFSGNSNKGGTIQAQSASGSYSVASNGRVTVTVAGPGANNLPIFYLVSPNKAFVLFTDSTLTNPHVEFGFLEPQTGGPFLSTSASGTYAFGTVWPSEINVSDDAGVATFAAPNINGTDDNISSGFSSPNNPFSFTFSIDSTGLGVIPSGCTIGTTCQTIFYVISPSKAVVFDVKPSTTTPTHPNLQVADK